MNPKELRIYSRDEHKQFIFSSKLSHFSNVRFLLGDVRDKANLRMAMDGADIVINAAALKHVPHCEFNPIEAVKTNVYGTQNIIEVAIEKNVERVLTISTDKATSPAGTMGASKLLSEKLMSAAQFQFGNRRTKFCSVRFGNVLGSRGSILNIFKEQIERGGPVNVTDKKMTRFIMLIPEAASLVLKACLLAQGGEIFILKMPSVRLIDMVNAAIEHYAPRYGRKSNDIKLKLIGMRPGERLHETLLTDEEAPTTLENKELFVVLPSLIPSEKRNIKGYGKDTRALRSGKTYCSDKVKLLTKKQMVQTIQRYELELKRRAHLFQQS
jgi:FlaA1/EpsC-like NDP-sugar epimerase